MREHGIGQFTVDAHRPVGRVRRARRLVLHRARLHQPAHRARPGRHPAARGRPRRRRTRSWSPAATPRSTPSRSPTSSTPRCSATASRSSARSPTSSASGRPTGRPAGATSCCCGWPRTGGVYVPRFYDVTTCPTAGSRRSCPNRAGVPARVTKHTVMDLDEWPYPKTPLVPLAETVHERMTRRDLPRLHPRLPVLPGRHDHPPGARALDHRHRRDGRAGPARPPASRRSGCCRCPSADHSEIGADRQAARPTATRTNGSRCRCRPPGSTRSTSTWPTSSPATAAAPG